MQPVHVIDVPLVCVHALCMYVFLRYAFINITFHVHEVINPRRACAGGLQYLSCVCLCVCLFKYHFMVGSLPNFRILPRRLTHFILYADHVALVRICMP